MVERLTRVMSATGSAKRTVGRLLVPTVHLSLSVREALGPSPVPESGVTPPRCSI